MILYKFELEHFVVDVDVRIYCICREKKYVYADFRK